MDICRPCGYRFVVAKSHGHGHIIQNSFIFVCVWISCRTCDENILLIDMMKTSIVVHTHFKYCSCKCHWCIVSTGGMAAMCLHRHGFPDMLLIYVQFIRCQRWTNRFVIRTCSCRVSLFMKVWGTGRLRDKDQVNSLSYLGTLANFWLQCIWKLNCWHDLCRHSSPGHKPTSNFIGFRSESIGNPPGPKYKKNTKFKAVLVCLHNGWFWVSSGDVCNAQALLGPLPPLAPPRIGSIVGEWDNDSFGAWLQKHAARTCLSSQGAPSHLSRDDVYAIAMHICSHMLTSMCMVAQMHNHELPWALTSPCRYAQFVDFIFRHPVMQCVGNLDPWNASYPIQLIQMSNHRFA